jgi:hypothetical protein
LATRQASAVAGPGFPAAHRLTTELGGCTRTHRLRYADAEYVIFCFPSDANAETFRARFDGKRITPARRKELAKSISSLR